VQRAVSVEWPESIAFYRRARNRREADVPHPDRSPARGGRLPRPRTLWLTFGRDTFEWEAFATPAIFVMALFIQRANRRDNVALHAKLDELLRVDKDARSELT
jgi:Low affinity iron permease